MPVRILLAVVGLSLLILPAVAQEAAAPPQQQKLNLAVGPFLVAKELAVDAAVWESRLMKAARASGKIFRKLPSNSAWKSGSELTNLDNLSWPEGKPDFFLLNPTISKSGVLWEVTATLASTEDPEFAVVSASARDDKKLMDALWRQIDRPLESIGVPFVSGIWESPDQNARTTLLVVQKGNQVVARVLDAPVRPGKGQPAYGVGTVTREHALEITFFDRSPDGSTSKLEPPQLFELDGEALKQNGALRWTAFTGMEGGEGLQPAEYLTKAEVFRQKLSYDAEKVKSDRAEYPQRSAEAIKGMNDAMAKDPSTEPYRVKRERAEKDPGVVAALRESEKVEQRLAAQVKFSYDLLLCEHYAARLLGRPDPADHDDREKVSALAWELEQKAISQNCPGGELGAGFLIIGDWFTQEANRKSPADDPGFVTAMRVRPGATDPASLDVEILAPWMREGLIGSEIVERGKFHADRKWSWSENRDLMSLQMVVVDPNAGRAGIQNKFVGYAVSNAGPIGLLKFGKSEIRVTFKPATGTPRSTVLRKSIGALP